MKLRAVTFMSKHNAERYPASSKAAFISVVCPCEEPARLAPGFVDILRLEFDDVDVEGKQFYEPIRGIYVDAVCFNKEHAAAVAEFVLRVKDIVETIHVHCLMGQSRSAGIAMAISECLLPAFNPLNPAFDKHNRKVASLLREAFIERGFVPPINR